MNNQETKNKIIVWEGFKKELPWIIFWILIMVMAYGYYQDKKICEEVLSDPCGICYKLNETLIDYLKTDNTNSIDLSVILKNNITIPYEDKNPNDRSISSFE